MYIKVESFVERVSTSNRVEHKNVPDCVIKRRAIRRNSENACKYCRDLCAYIHVCMYVVLKDAFITSEFSYSVNCL